MMQLKLALPTPADEQEVWEYRQEFLEQGSSLDGSGGLEEAESFAQWYSKTLANRSEQTVCPGLVPATTFLAVDADGKLVGMIDIRHRLNEGLLLAATSGTVCALAAADRAMPHRCLRWLWRSAAKCRCRRCWSPATRRTSARQRPSRKTAVFWKTRWQEKKTARTASPSAIGLPCNSEDKKKTGLLPKGSRPVFYICRRLRSSCQVSRPTNKPRPAR